jgi:hypothetical protein
VVREGRKTIGTKYEIPVRGTGQEAKKPVGGQERKPGKL